MSQVTEEPGGKANASLLIKGAIWVAIGALIAAALVCVVWVLVGDQDGIIGRAFLTILLLAGFAGVAILEAGLATKRPEWLALASMITWIVALIVGAIKIWLPAEPYEYAGGIGRLFMLLLVVGVLQLALLHVRLLTPAARRYVTTFTRIIYYVTIAMLVLLVAMLVIYLTIPDTFEYGDLYWRIVVALAILTAVGTTLIPLLNALFAPKKRADQVPAQHAPQGYAPQTAPALAAPIAQQWPTYADGMTPLPVLPDGSPDWNAYYTGYPTPQYAPVAPAAQSFPVASDYGQVPTPGHSQTPPYQPAPQDPQVQSTPPVPPAPGVPPVPQAPSSTEPVTPAQPVVPDPPAPGSFPPPPPAPPQ